MNIVEALYYSGFVYKKHQGLKKQKRLPSPVISVGNITMGGTGKTPLVIALSMEAVARGYKPCILTRGYMSKSGNPRHASMGRGQMSNALDLGDEPVLMAQKTKGVEIIVGADRYKSGTMSGNANLFIMDDGFQHWRLHRDVDIALVDTTSFGNEKLIPFGSLREPRIGLNRADIIVKTRSDQGEHSEIDKMLNKYGIKSPIFNAVHNPTYFVNLRGERFGINKFAGKKVFVFAGIGNPEAFKLTLKSLRVEIAGTMMFRDHHPYSSGDITELIRKSISCGAKYLLTTEKDLIKISTISGSDDIYALGLDLVIDKNFYDTVFSSIEEIK